MKHNMFHHQLEVNKNFNYFKHLIEEIEKTFLKFGIPLSLKIILKIMNNGN